MFTPSKLQFMRQRRFISVMQFQGIQQKALDGNAANIDTVLQSAGAGNPLLTEIGTTGIMGLLMAAAGDDVRHCMAIPGDWDRAQAINVYVHWATEAASATSRAAVWKFLYGLIIPETTAIATPATVLDTAIASDPAKGTAKVWQRSPAGVLKGGTIADAVLALAFLVELDDYPTTTTFTENKYLLGVEFEYAPKVGVSHQEGQAPAWVA